MATGIHPLLNVSSLEKSIEFYKGLGLDAKLRTEQGMTWGEVRSGRQTLMLADKNDGPDAGDPWLSGELGKGVLLTVGVADARKTFAKAQELRASVDRPLMEQPWGGMGFMISDPDGYVLAFSDADWEEASSKRKPARKRAAKSAGRARKAAKPAKAKAAKRPAKKRATKRRR